MYEYNRVIKGITTYIDTEIIDKIAGWKKWVVGSGIGLAMSNTTNVFNQIKSNEFIKLLGVIDENDKIDVDKIYKEMKQQASKGAITFDMPLVGPLTLNESDVDKMYDCIKNA